MAAGKFVVYLRVSTQRQGDSGLGLDAQREAVRQYLNGGGWEVVQEFVEVESGRKSDQQRPELAKALALAKREGAQLLVAKLDRLARNVHFISGLMQSGVKFVALDLPEANDLTIHIMAAFAEHEAKRIAQRTKDAIAVKKGKVEMGIDPKAPGVTDWSKVWGVAGAANLKRNIRQRQQQADSFADSMRREIAGMRDEGMTQRKMVAELNRMGRKTTGGGEWSLIQLQRVIKRINEIESDERELAEAVELETNPHLGKFGT